MRLPQRVKWKWNYSALAFLIPFLGMLMVMIISGYKPFGSFSMLYSDMYHQYYPFFVDFRRALRSGDSLLYSWSVGMGIDYLGLIAYYLGSPLNLLSVLVPEKMVLSYFSLLVPVKLGLAALFFSIFLKKIFGRDDLSISIFGSFYGLCAWALAFQWNIMWLDTFALLPLVVLGTVQLLRERRFVLYTLSLFLAVFANYYIGLFVCFFVGLLFFCYEICYGRSVRRFFADLGLMALFSALALGMTAVLTYSAYAALQTTQSSVNAFPKGFKLNIASSNTFLGLLGAMRSVAGNMGGAIEPSFKEGLPNLYCGVGSILLAILFLSAGEIRLREKLCAVFLLLFFNLSFIIRQLDYIWHGFHFTNMIPYRFSFLYSFVLLYMAYRAWLLRRNFGAVRVIVSVVLTACILCLSDSLTQTTDVKFLGAEWKIYIYILYNFIFLILYTAAMLSGVPYRHFPEEMPEEEVRSIRVDNARRQIFSRWCVFSIATVELTATLLSFGLYFPGTNVANYPKGTDSAASIIRYMKERESDNLFYRAETAHSQSLNDGALNGYRGISAFTSSANVHITEFMQALGYGAKNTYNRYCYEESSPVADLFLNVRYMIERDGKDRASTYFTDVHHNGNVHLLENNTYLPLGFLAERSLADVEFKSGQSAFTFQNTLFSAATGVEENVWYRLHGDNALQIYGKDVTVADEDGYGGCSYSGSKSNSEVLYTYTADRPGFVCIHVNFPKRNDIIIGINGVDLYRESTSLPQMLAVADVQPGDLIDIRVICKEGEASTLAVAAAILDPAVFREGYEKLAASTLDLTSFSNTRITGNIDCNRNGLLYLSVPQTGNWKAYVDGAEVPTLLVGDCMTGLEMTEGRHTVELLYHNDAFVLGRSISLGCAVIFAGIVLACRYAPKKRSLPEEPEKNEE